MLSESRYAKPDLLFRLCKTVGDGIYGTLKAYNDIHRKGSKQWRLFEYYRALPDWNQTQEQVDWEGENLNVLKHRTLKWLLKSMSRIGNWPNRDLIELIGEISWGLKEGAGEYLFELTKVAKRIAWSREAFHLLEEILRLEMQVIQAGDFQGYSQGTAKNILEEKQRVARIKEELVELMEIRIIYLEPRRAEAKNDGRIMRSLGDELNQVLSKINPARLMSSIARLDYFDMALKCSLIRGAKGEAAKYADEMGMLYDSQPWLVGHDFAWFFSRLLNRIAAYALAGKLQSATALISEFDSHKDLGEGANRMAVIPKLQALFYLYEITFDPLFAKEALAAHKRVLANYDAGDPKNLDQINFFVSITSLDFGWYSDAIAALEEILRRKSVLSPLKVAHARVMLLIAYIGLKHDQEFLQGQVLNCKKLIKRQMNTPPELLEIIRLLGKLVKKLGTPDEAQNAAEELVAYTTSLTDQEHVEVKVDYRYAKWIERAIK